MVRFDIFTLFPGMFCGPLDESILSRASARGLVSIAIHNIRDYAYDKHHITDDTPYGGGGGMVMKPEPIFAAVEAVLADELNERQDLPIVLLSPQGRLFSHTVALGLSRFDRIALICGHYEGVDERVREHLVTDEISIGDYVLTGGELAAMVVVDAVTRLLPGVLGDPGATLDDSHAHGLLEGPHYTRPVTFRGWEVPEILRSGDHGATARWRREQALKRTWERRPDLLANADLTAADLEWLAGLETGRHDRGD
ncbi:MAG: tRNA (guanosine(37)-N1)-methyltransferase TrmD [Anaerolineales bacterium]|nr:tRNA (guanosine(37)-N1)-methyltransferase TrmD [Anaerolineales bacterium]